MEVPSEYLLQPIPCPQRIMPVIDALSFCELGIGHTWETLKVPMSQPHGVDSHHISSNTKKVLTVVVKHVGMIPVLGLAEPIAPVLLITPHDEAYPHASTLKCSQGLHQVLRRLILEIRLDPVTRVCKIVTSADHKYSPEIWGKILRTKPVCNTFFKLSPSRTINNCIKTQPCAICDTR